ncbi:MAG: hypothetical protein U9O87_10655 [Verrucomicrobiota bacterium]|nr:hypothetical protein [Verrucomicrobiota bacterium]
MTKQYYKLQRSLDKDAFSKDVTKGKDGWLFLGQVTPGYKRFSDPIGDAMHVSRYTPEQLDAFIDYITTLQKWLKQKGIQYLFVIAPNKHTIYFEKLPDYIKKQNIESVTDQLVKALKDRTSIPVVDLRKSLLKAKGKYQLYYKTDSHWTHYAANIAQFEIMKRIQLMFPKRLTPKLYPDSFFSIFQKKDGDLCKLSKIVGISEKSPQPNFTGKDPVRKNIEENDKFFQTTCHSGNINAVIFRDSFFGYLVPYFSRKFNKTTFIWDMLSYEKLTKTLNKGKPDLVIEEWIERTLPYIPEEQTLFKKDL